jgi:hypothetical protein
LALIDKALEDIPFLLTLDEYLLKSKSKIWNNYLRIRKK